MKNKKRLLSFILSIVMTVTMIVPYGQKSYAADAGTPVKANLQISKVWQYKTEGNDDKTTEIFTNKGNATTTLGKDDKKVSVKTGMDINFLDSSKPNDTLTLKLNKDIVDNLLENPATANEIKTKIDAITNINQQLPKIKKEIEENNSKLDSLEQKKKNLEEEVKKIEAEINNPKAEKEEIKKAITEKNNAIAKLKSEINEIKKVLDKKKKNLDELKVEIDKIQDYIDFNKYTTNYDREKYLLDKIITLDNPNPTNQKIYDLFDIALDIDVKMSKPKKDETSETEKKDEKKATESNKTDSGVAEESEQTYSDFINKLKSGFTTIKLSPKESNDNKYSLNFDTEYQFTVIPDNLAVVKTGAATTETPLATTYQKDDKTSAPIKYTVAIKTDKQPEFESKGKSVTTTNKGIQSINYKLNKKINLPDNPDIEVYQVDLQKYYTKTKENNLNNLVKNLLNYVEEINKSNQENVNFPEYITKNFNPEEYNINLSNNKETITLHFKDELDTEKNYYLVLANQDDKNKNKITAVYDNIPVKPFADGFGKEEKPEKPTPAISYSMNIDGLQYFNSNDTKDVKNKININTNKIYKFENPVYLDTGLNISFKGSDNKNLSFEAKKDKDIKDFINIKTYTFEPDGSENLVDAKGIKINKDNNQIKIKGNFKPDTNYRITVDPNQLEIKDGDKTIDTIFGKDDTKRFVFDFKTEKQPEGTFAGHFGDSLKIKYDRKVEINDKSKIKIKSDSTEIKDFEAEIDKKDNMTLLLTSKEFNSSGFLEVTVEDKAINRIKQNSEEENLLFAKEFKHDEKAKHENVNTITDYIELKQYANAALTKVYQNSDSRQKDLQAYLEREHKPLNNKEIETDSFIKVKFTRTVSFTKDFINNLAISGPGGKNIPIKYITDNESKANSYDKYVQSGDKEGLESSVSDSFNELYIVPAVALEPETNYSFKLKSSSRLFDTETQTAITTKSNEVYNFTTETRPKVEKIDYQKPEEIENKNFDQRVSIIFDKPVQIIDKDKINSQITILGKNAKNASANGNSLSFTVDKSITKDLYARDVKVKVASDALKRAGSKNVNVLAFDYKLGIKNEKQDLIDQYKDEVADALAKEMEKRYQAEYGTNADYISFNDYIKEKYIKDKDKPYIGQNYIQLYLKDKGYVDDFIAKYGRDPINLESFAEDYMNRYGQFAFNPDDARTNPFFSDPFRDFSHKNGYYDYYNYYDYGYKFPEIRRGDDFTNQATREKEQALDQKLSSLSNQQIQKEINSGQKYSAGGFLSPKIIIDTHSRYMTYFDKFGNMTTTDMGVSPVENSGRLFIPVGPVAQKSGMWVSYNNKTKQSTFSRAGTISAISPNSSYITVNGKSENMGIRPLVKNSRMMIPVQYLQKILGLESTDIIFDRAQNKIEINNF